MELIRTLRERSQTKRQEFATRQAECLITLSDFADSLFIAYQGTPLIPIEESWTSKEILQELSKIRQNYINAHLQDNNKII